MTFTDFPILADENIHSDVVAYLQESGLDIVSVSGSSLAGASDLVLLESAYSQGRIILTQDADFGRFIFTRDIPFIGIVHLRPGHFFPAFHISTMKSIISSQLNLISPFILVAENNQTNVRMRLRLM